MLLLLGDTSKPGLLHDLKPDCSAAFEEVAAAAALDYGQDCSHAVHEGLTAAVDEAHSSETPQLAASEGSGMHRCH